MRKFWLKDSEKGDVKRYIVYSFGEIILVVFSILLALQIDKWNEEEKARNFEIYILNEILNNIKEDQTQIRKIFDQRGKTKEAIDRMAFYLPGNQIDEDQFSKDLAQLFTFERYFPIRNAYEILKSKGLGISSDSLRTKLARYYEYHHYRVNESIKDVEKAFLDDFSPYFRKGHFLKVEYGKYLILRNYKDKTLIKDIIELLFLYKENHYATYLKIEEFMEINASIKAAVNKELNRLKED